MHIIVHPSFADLTVLAKLVSETFGKSCETVLFDMIDGNNIIVYIANGHVTNRKIGDIMIQHELDCIDNIYDNNCVLNYRHVTKDGHILKSSLYLIKDENGEVIGCFCINFDITNLVVANNVIDSLLLLNQQENIQNSNSNVGDILTSMVNNTLEQVGIPVSYLNKEDKVELVKKLNTHGVFLIKGAVDYVAERLCVSRYTIYNYLEEIK